ncbi:MAG TPA: hypothetical protein VGX76_16315, partial [Pirellulales bacterium]|nr:hypothetical protein [Pirellulales bacterium]
MNLEVEEFSLRRVRLLTVILLIVVAVATALANLSSEPLTVDSFENMYTPAFRIRERAYGWPLAWYWRSAKMVQGTGVVSGLQWNVSRHSASCLTANLAMWLVMLAALSVASKWLLRRFPPRLYRPRLHGRPRVSTLIALMLVLAPMVLANLSFDRSPERGAPQQVSYGWPLIWHWRIVVGTHYAAIVAWDYSVAGLAGNVVLWILILAVIGLSCEWLLRRYPPRLRWSLRTMLAAVGLLAVLCAWCTAARRLAQEQDAVIAWVGDDDVYMERWGPKWLDLVGADRFRRRIVGARVCYFDNEELNELLFERLARLHGLRFLDIHFDGFTPGMAATLSDLQQLRILNVNSATWDTLHKDHWDDVQGSIHECLAAAGKLTQLERL